MRDNYHLQRFIDAQGRVYEAVVAELRAGHKRTHWMWFVFPQLRGLGASATAQHFAISCLDEARAYLNDPLLGTRLRECTRLAIEAHAKTIESLFPYPDNLKFRSSMTLFAHADPSEPLFRQALRQYFAGADDPLTVARL